MPTFDVVIYGATPAGLFGAMRAESLGLTVAVLEPTAHRGGTLTGGLSKGDKTSTKTTGTYVHDFLVASAAEYPGSADGAGENFDTAPSIAQAILTVMLAAHPDVTVVLSQVLLAVNIVRDGDNRRIASIDVTGGNYIGANFIDASYEGDLAAMAGVTMGNGRDSERTFAEAGAGYQPSKATTMSSSPLDAAGFRVKFMQAVADPAWLLNGDADNNPMAFSYRLCCTKHSSRLPWPQPPGYNAADFAGIANRIAAFPATTFEGGIISFASLPLQFAEVEDDRKYDMNGTSWFSNSVSTMNAEWATASWARRQEIMAAIYYYEAGQFYWLANDAAVPGTLQDEVNDWGLCADEFTADFYGSAGWSPAVYVRESRFLRGAQYTTRYRDTKVPNNVKEDSIATAGYPYDAHHSRRYFKNATSFYVEAPQGIAGSSGQYAISARSVMPWPGQCSNLLVPVCAGVSRQVMTTYRLEETWATVGEVCGLWAGLAADLGMDTSEYPYVSLRGVMDGLSFAPDPT